MNLPTFIGYILLFAAFLLAGGEGMAHVMRNIDGAYLSAYDLWHTFWPSGVIQARLFIQQNLSPVLWESVIAPVLLLPAWSIPGLPGLLLVWFCRVRSADFADEAAALTESMLMYDRLADAAKQDEDFDNSGDDLEPYHFDPIKDGGYEAEDLENLSEDDKFLNDWESVDDLIDRAKREGIADHDIDDMLSKDRIGNADEEDK